MNTRLQVEHPVTEWITGLDLVRLQLEVAGGAALPPEALTPSFVGHAIECRIYAEDPAAGHLPQAGRLMLMREPAGPGVRVDAALAEGQEIGVHFDPMLAKLSCWARDRDAAVARMQEALRRYVLLGVQTNIDHLQAILAVPAFREGDITTAFLDDHLADWPPSEELPPLAMAATLLADRYGTGRVGHADTGATDPLASDPWRTLGRFRLGSADEVSS